MTKSFKDFQLGQEIQEAFAGLHYSEPTEVQARVIPLALEGQDLVVRAQTGSGKTAAFAAPICEDIDWEENKPQALILTPTRELAMQVQQDVQLIGRFKRITAALLVGQQPAAPQRLQLKQKVHVVVGTPGRVLDHIQKGTLQLDEIKHVVLDEADEMLNMGFLDQVESIIRATPRARTTSLFSATLPEKIMALAKSHMQDPEQIIVETSIAKKDIEYRWFETHPDDKFDAVKNILMVEKPESAILFFALRESVDQFAADLEKAGIPCGKIHGGLEQKDRTKVMQDFKRGTLRYLLATDVAARGIDVASLPLVINVDVPEEPANFVHRTGRTARAGESGKAITLVALRDGRSMGAIKRMIKEKVTLEPVPMATKSDSDKFMRMISEAPQLKKSKRAPLDKNIMKLYFNGGKRKKLRAVDFVGTLTSIPEIEAEDIGVINIEQLATYVDILNGKGSIALQEMQERTVKGKNLKVREARD
ncbi:DEAD/DEAH box helicase [Paenalkalicoccus suaedae]